MMSKKYMLYRTFKAVVLVAMIACSAGPVGFNAPDGAVVEFTVPSQSFQVSSGELLIRMVAKVTQDIGLANEIEGSSVVTGPAANVFLLIDCFGCTLYTKREGEAIAVTNYSKIQLEVDGNIEAKTNSQGIYDFVAGFSAPAADSNYTTTVRADIGTSVGSATVSISNPAD